MSTIPMEVYQEMIRLLKDNAEQAKALAQKDLEIALLKQEKKFEQELRNKDIQIEALDKKLARSEGDRQKLEQKISRVKERITEALKIVDDKKISYYIDWENFPPKVNKNIDQYHIIGDKDIVFFEHIKTIVDLIMEIMNKQGPGKYLDIKFKMMLYDKNEYGREQWGVIKDLSRVYGVGYITTEKNFKNFITLGMGILYNHYAQSDKTLAITDIYINFKK